IFSGITGRLALLRNYATAEKCGIWGPVRRISQGTPSLHYLRSIIFDTAVVILTLVISLSVPFLWLFNASSATVRSVSQGSAGRQALRQMNDEARRAIGEGRKVLIFPQGTRQAVDQPMTFQPAGIAALYTNLGVPVLPTAHNSGLFWGKKTLMIHGGVITLSYLPPIPPG